MAGGWCQWSEENEDLLLWHPWNVRPHVSTSACAMFLVPVYFWKLQLYSKIFQEAHSALFAPQTTLWFSQKSKVILLQLSQAFLTGDSAVCHWLIDPSPVTVVLLEKMPGEPIYCCSALLQGWQLTWMMDRFSDCSFIKFLIQDQLSIS